MSTLLRHLVSDAVRLRGSPRRLARAVRLACYARRASRLVPPDTARLHAHFANDAATLARYLSALTGIPFRVTAHAYDLFQDPFLLGPNLGVAEHVYTVTGSNLEFLRARARAEAWDTARFSILRCGIDLAEFAYRDPPPPRRPARLLCVSRLVPKKGHAVLLDAVARALGEGLDMELTVAGDGPLSKEIRERAARIDLRGRVNVVGAVPAERALALMKSADLLIQASRIAEDGDRDGLPVSLIEAMALGVPVVSTEVSGIPELVTPRTGWLVPPDSPEKLAAVIRKALDEPPEDRIARTRRGRERVESEFDVTIQVRTLRP